MSVVGDAKMAKKVLEFYSEGNSTQKGAKRPNYVVVNDDQQEDLEISDGQQKALNDVLGDGVIQDSERKTLGNAGFSDEFVNKVAGSDGHEALKKRMVWLSGNIGKGFWGKDPVARLRNALEFKRAKQDLMNGKDVQFDPEQWNALDAGTAESKDVVASLVDVVNDEDEDEGKRLEALKGLVELGTDKSVQAFVENMDHVDFALARPELIERLGNLPFHKFSPETREKIVNELVGRLKSQSSVNRQAALSSLNKIFLRSIDRGDYRGGISYAMEQVEQLAQNSTHHETRMYALICLANTGQKGVDYAAPELNKIAEQGEDPKLVATANKKFIPDAREEQDLKTNREIAQAQAKVQDAKRARLALRRMQIQVDASTTLRPTLLRTPEVREENGNKFLIREDAMDLLTS